MKRVVQSFPVYGLILASVVTLVSGCSRDTIKCHYCRWTPDSGSDPKKDDCWSPRLPKNIRSYEGTACAKMTGKIKGVDIFERSNGANDPKNRVGKCSDTWQESNIVLSESVDPGTWKICYCGTDECNNSPGMENEPTGSTTRVHHDLALALSAIVPYILFTFFYDF